MRDEPLSNVLLRWYDAHARALPWRVGPSERLAGILPDPYRVWLSEIMLQQTTVAAVRDYFLRFVTRWPTVSDLAAAKDADVMGEWAGLGYYARARNLLKCARVVAIEHDGRFPESRDELLGLPGIGPYTASAIAAIAFDLPETVVDGNVERVMARLHAVEDPLPGSKRALARLAATHTPAFRPGDYAQAVMDLGATVCSPRRPACGICPCVHGCAARAAGLAEALPRKTPKTEKPVRLGVVWIGRRDDGAWLLETRPERGLLGGMLGWPGTDWSGSPLGHPPANAAWRDLGAEVRHTFTHFHLRLSVKVAELPADAVPNRGSFVLPRDFRASDLPTVMRKAFALASPALEAD